MTPLTLALATAPGLLISAYIYYRDSYEKEPNKYLILCFFFGVISTLPAIWLEGKGQELGYDVSPNLWTTFIFAFVVVGGSEEFVKFFFLRGYIYPKETFDEPMDGIVYSVMIGMGFATLENILYTSYGLETTIIRAFTAVPAHGAFAVVMGYYVGLAKFSDRKQGQFLLQGFLSAVLLHGAYDFFIFQKNYPALAGLTMVILVAGIFIGKRLIKIHQELSPFKDKSTETVTEEQELVINDLDFVKEEPTEQEKKEDEEEGFTLL